MSKIISGIQQIGIGVSDVHEAWKWYRQNLGFDVPVFEEAAEAGLMLPYTGGEPRKRHAVLALNLLGGGGFEIWQYTSRKPEGPSFEVKLGDLGIAACKIKAPDVLKAHQALSEKSIPGLTPLYKDPKGNKHCFFHDPYGNWFEIVEEKSGWFKNEKKPLGGVGGAIVAVTNIDKSRELYSGILGYDEVVYDESGKFDDLAQFNGGDASFRRVLLKHKGLREGRFSELFGPTSVELIQVLDRAPVKIYENRFWGDLGFIHLCFDVVGMHELKSECESKGYPFTVDSSNSFDMGEAAGHFSYIEDPDGTLIEFVETHKIPIVKKWNWYIDLRKRPREKPLPKWILRSMGLMRVKD